MQAYERANTPTLRRWLAGRSASERATLAQIWRLPPGANDMPEALADALLDPARVAAMLAALDPRERAVLARVQEYGGSLPAAIVEREFGRVRHYGTYPNPRAYLLALAQPATPTERLWIMGLLHEQRDGARRTFGISPDLLTLLPPVPPHAQCVQVTPVAAPPQEYAGEIRTIERNLLTLLVLAQDGQITVVPSGGMNKTSLLRLVKHIDPTEQLKGITREEHWPFMHFLRLVATGAGLLRVGADALLRPTSAALDWLRQPPTVRARRLLDGWVQSDWDELVSFVGLKFQRAYGRDLAAAKWMILQLVGQVPPGAWVALDEFVAVVKAVEPDFGRADGRYDSWGIVSYVREPLDGFEHWEAVEGQQLRSIIGGTLRWLGLTDLGYRDEQPHSFRVTALGAALLCDAPPPAEPAIEPLIVQPNFEVLAPRYAALDARFQLARIAEPVAPTSEDDARIYKLTKRSVQKALEHQITLDDMLRFLREQSGRELPQNVAVTLREWDGQHGQVALRKAVLLEAEEPALLEQLRHDKRIKMPHVEPLSKNAWVVREGDAPGLAERLRKAGYGLTGDGDAPATPIREHDLTVLYTALEFYASACVQLGVESEITGAMQQRIAKLLSEKQYNRAHQSSAEALRRLKDRL